MEDNNSLHVTPKKSCNETYPSCEDELRPQIGMCFNSLQEGVEFYKNYAHHVGFSVRLSSQTKKDGIVYWKYLVCSKEGWHQEKEPELAELELSDDIVWHGDRNEKGKKSDTLSKRRRGLTREGCMATCALKRTEDAKFQIFKFHEGHTHALATPSKKYMLRSARKVNPLLKNMIRACHRTNVGTSATFNIVKEQIGGIANIGCTRRDLQNYHRDLKSLIENSDGHMFIDNLKRMKEKNSSFFYAYEMDDQKRLKHVFWADGIGRKNYALFGDSVTFDTTYGTNKYSLVFAPFTGINHHRQSISFAAGFLSSEKVESFVWIFERFLEAMGGHQPRCIMTDQDPAMKIAIERVLDASVHRFCIWHIMRKVSEKVGGALNGDIGFHSQLKACVWGSEMPEEFESRWSTIVSSYELGKNDWFTLMHNLRKMWIPAYFRDVFLAGLLRTTSRSESQNSMFGHFLNKQLSLVEFWMRFDCAIDIQRDNERELDHVNSYSIPRLKTDMDLEKHGREVYTHANFYIFQDELWASCFDCMAVNVEEGNGFMIFTVRDNGKKCHKPTRQVMYNASTLEAKCTCKFYELEGIPCRHIIVVLRGDMQMRIPDSLIANRWTKSATRKPVFDETGILLTASTSRDSNKARLVSRAWENFFEIMHTAKEDEDELKIVLEGCSNIKKLLSNKGEKEPNKVEELETYADCIHSEQVDIHPPNSASTKGSRKRIKGGKELAMEEQKKRTRHCKACGKYATHDSRNCPTKDL